MNRLEVAWANWRALNRVEWAMFLTLVTASSIARTAGRRGPIAAPIGARGASELGELTLTEGDLTAALAE